MGTAGVILTPSIIKAMTVENSNPRLLKPGADLIKSGYAWDQDEIFIRVTNTNQEPVDVMLLGVKKNITGNFIPDGVKIAVSGSSYKQLLDAIQLKPIIINRMKIRVKNAPQFHNPIFIFLDNYEKVSTNSFYLVSFRSATSIDFTIIDCPFGLKLCSSTYLLQKINPNEQVDYRFTIADNDNLKIFK
jgi:hypothetical protein